MLYSGKSVCIRARVVVFQQSGYIRIKWLYSGKLVILGQMCSYSGKYVVFGKVVVFGQSGCSLEKVVVIRQK